MGENYLGAPTAMTTTNEGGHAMAIEHDVAEMKHMLKDIYRDTDELLKEEKDEM